MEDSGSVPGGPVRLWLPGLHAADPRVRRVARAVELYDESLRLARHTTFGDWVVTIGENGHPVFGFGRDLPDPEKVPALLAARDIKRHGKKLMADLAAKAAREHAAAEHDRSERTGEIAEHFEHAFRQEGKHPTPRIFIPRSI